MTVVLADESRLIVTGQIGCGKTTFSSRLAAIGGYQHVPLDPFNERADPLAAAGEAVRGLGGRWIVEACVWQIPEPAWDAADLAIHLDYPNHVLYRRIVRRGLTRFVKARRWADARLAVVEERGHLRIMRNYATENRERWRAKGGITDRGTRVITLRRPAEARAVLRSLSAVRT